MTGGHADYFDLYGIVIQMVWRDHNPPHFHASYGGEEAVIDIATSETIAGSLPARATLLVKEWTSAHRSELLENWELCRTKQRPKRIDPLS